MTKLTLATGAVNYGAAAITKRSEAAMTIFQILGLAAVSLVSLGAMLVVARRQLRRSNRAAVRRAAIASVGPGRNDQR